MGDVDPFQQGEAVRRDWITISTDTLSSWTSVTDFALGLINTCVSRLSILDFQNLRYGASFGHLSSVTAGN